MYSNIIMPAQKKKMIKPSQPASKYESRGDKKPKKVYQPGLDLDSARYLVRPIKPAYSNTKKFKETYNKIDNKSQAFIDQIIDPDSAESTIRHPNTYGLSSVFKGVNILNAAFDVNGESIAIVHPNMSNAIFTTAAANYDFDITKSNSTTAAQNYLIQQLRYGSSSNKQIDITEPFFFGDNHAALPIPHENQGSIHYLYPIAQRAVAPSLFATPQIIASIDNYPDLNGTTVEGGPMTITARWYSGALNELGSSSDIQNNLNQFVIRCSDATNQASFISLRITYNGNHSYEGNVTMTLRESSDVTAPATFPMRLSHFYTHCIVTDINGSKQIETSCEKFMVIAQSLLVTYRGSTLSNAGLISSARVCAGTDSVGAKSQLGVASSAGGSAYYNWCSSLNNMRMDGPLKDGCFSWYLGSDPSHYFYRDVETQSYSDYPYLVAAFQCPVATSANTIRIKVVTHVQFTTNNTVYDQKPSPFMKNKELLFHILSMINSSYSNDGHKQGLTEQLKSIGKSIGKALINPSTYLDIAEILMILGL